GLRASSTAAYLRSVLFTWSDCVGRTPASSKGRPGGRPRTGGSALQRRGGVRRKGAAFAVALSLGSFYPGLVAGLLFCANPTGEALSNGCAGGMCSGTYVRDPYEVTLPSLSAPARR